jgi:hypothetical protein
MPARRRTYDWRSRVEGAAFNMWGTPQVIFNHALVGSTGVCDDVVTYGSHGKYILPNVFNSRKCKYQRASITGEYRIDGTLYRSFEAYPVEYQAEPCEAVAVFPDPSPTEQSNMWWKIVTTTSPAKADVSLPTFIGELHQIPSMLMGWGETLPDKAISSHLNWRWGIIPFVSDVKKMLRFVELSQKRFDMLKRLRNGEVISRRCDLGNVSFTEAPRNVMLQSYLATVNAQCTTTYTCKTWGTVRWKLRTDANLPMIDSKLLTEAKKLVVGWKSVEVIAATWELFPWSWFLDWFFKIGPMLGAVGGACTYQWSNACVMRTLTSKTTYDITNRSGANQWFYVSGEHSEELLHKLRWPVAAAGPPIDVIGPLLQGKNWSILGTLWVLQSKDGFARALRGKSVRTPRF